MFFNEKFCPDYGSTFWFCQGTYLPKIWTRCCPPPLLKWAHFSNTGLAKKVRKHKIFLQHCLLAYWFSCRNFLQVEANSIVFRSNLGIAKVSDGDKVPGGRLLPSLVGKIHHRFDLSIQSFRSAALICQILQFCLFRKDSFYLIASRYF